MAPKKQATNKTKSTAPKKQTAPKPMESTVAASIIEDKQGTMVTSFTMKAEDKTEVVVFNINDR